MEQNRIPQALWECFFFKKVAIIQNFIVSLRYPMNKSL